MRGSNCSKRLGIREILVMGRMMKHCSRRAGEMGVLVVLREEGH